MADDPTHEPDGTSDPATTVGGNLVLLWQAGRDPWRDLREELGGCASTLITAKGSVRVLNPAARWQMRLRAPGRSAIAGDGRRVELDRITVASSCGIVTWGSTAHSWSASSRLVSVYAGEPDLAQIPAVVDPAETTFDPDGHPPTPCGAVYCVHGDRWTWRP